MVRSLLIRGMLIGILAGLFIFALGKTLGEPQVDRAIAVETQLAKAAGEPEEPELVSREVQASIGLLTGSVVYGVAYGGIFSLVFAYAYGRLGRISPRAVAAVLALAGFVVVALVPALKYPPNPPSVGNPDTIGIRTALYFMMILVSVAAAVSSLSAGRALRERLGSWNAAIVGGLLFITVVAAVQALMPDINEVPSEFPAVVLWRFRTVSLGMQGILWATMGILFGMAAEKLLAPQWRRSQASAG